MAQQKEALLRRLSAAQQRAHSVSSMESANSLASHPIDASEAAAAPRRHGGRRNLRLVSALVPLAAAAGVVAAAARSRGRPARRPRSPASRKVSQDRFEEPREVPFAAPKPWAFSPRK